MNPSGRLPTDDPVPETPTGAVLPSAWFGHLAGRIPHWIWLPATTLALAALFALSPLYQRLGQACDDLHQRVFARTQSFDASLVIDIDEASLRELQPLVGAWPFKRDLYAAVADYLKEAGAKAVVFDILFADARDGDGNNALRASVERGAIVLASSALTQPFKIDADEMARLQAASWPAAPDTPATDWTGLTLPNAGLLVPGERPAPLGVISVTTDHDGVLRSMPLLHRIAGHYFPSLAVAAHFAAPGMPAPGIEARNGRLRIGGLDLPVDAQGRTAFVFPRNPDAVPTLPFDQVVAAALGVDERDGLRAAIRGRTVFIGSTAFFSDRVMTPVGQMNGATLIAIAFEALGQQNALRLRPSSWDLLLLALALLPVLLGALQREPRPARVAVFSVGALVLLLALDVGLYAFASQQVDLVLPLLVLLTGLGLNGARHERWVTLRHQRLRHERELADAANKAKSEFLSNMSHEIRTPMNALLGMAQLLSETGLDAQQRRYVDVFRSAGQNLLDLINDLLDLSKIEAGRFELSSEPFSLRDMLAEQLRLLEPRAREKSLTLSVEMQPGLPDGVEGDRKRLTQVLVNLVGNAIKFTSQGNVRVAVEVLPSAAHGLHFTVTDTGMGIAADMLELIFDPFVQADRSITRRFGGTGLGLAIAKRLVEMMGGRIWVNSKPDHGTTFHFTVVMPSVAPSRLETSAVPQAAAPLRAPMDILLAEDVQNNVFVVQSFLKGTGDRIVVAVNGQQAVDLFKSGRFDLVLMDVHMPGKDGYTAAREIRQIEAAEARPRTPIVALTANVLEGDMRKSLDAGCDDHLGKPIDKLKLLKLIARFGRAPDTDGASAAPGATDQPHTETEPSALDKFHDSGLFDLDTALARLGDDHALFLDLLDMAVQPLLAWPKDFSDARARGDDALAHRLTHNLKNLSSSLGADTLAHAAQALETALAKQRLDEVDTLVDDVTTTLQVVNRAIAGVRGQEALLAAQD